jgi:hypothetical protein
MGIRKLRAAMTTAAAAAITGLAISVPASASPAGPVTGLHYTSNGNWSSSGAYEPGQLGFNLADVGASWELAYLPAGVKALVWLGDCGGATTSFQSQVQPFIGSPQVWGFYLMDEPSPSSCPAADLQAESDWIHTNDPGAKTFIIEQNLSASYSPNYMGDYTPANSDIDYYGLDPYPCRDDTYPVPLNGCNYNYITLDVNAAEAAGIPQAAIVPVYQAFGGGTWTDDGSGTYLLPTAAQEQQILSTWAGLIPSPAFDYAYSWGVQNNDTALSDAPASLQQVFATANGNSGGTSQAPAVTTNAASGVTSSGATLNGSVNSEGQSTTYQFDYGTTTSYGSSVPSPAGSAGSGTGAVNESASLTGLRPGTTYHYRIEATNATGTTYGSDQTFTTARHR